jgi:predicted component of type VI protein secretion system
MNPDMSVAPGPGWPAKYYSSGVSIAERAATRFTAADYTGKATSAEEYLRESIVQTNAYVVAPYVANIMPKIYGEQMAAQDLADVIAYLQTIK